MKKTILSIGLMLCVAIGAKAQDAAATTTPNPVNPNAAKFKFESELIDYGTIEHNADGNRTFKFTNVGKEDLVISNIVGSCGCTTAPDWPRQPIKPGATASFKVHYATDRVGAFEKTVTISSNADTPAKTLKIKGVVKPDPNPETPAAPVAAPAAPAEQKH